MSAKQYGLTYDREEDILLLALPQPRGPSVSTVTRAGKDVVIDFDKAGALCMAEVLNASKYYPEKWLNSLPDFDDPELTLAEAVEDAAKHGAVISSTTLRVQINNGRIPLARKRGSDWVIPQSALHNYLERRTQGRRTDLEEKRMKVRKRARA